MESIRNMQVCNTARCCTILEEQLELIKSILKLLNLELAQKGLTMEYKAICIIEQNICHTKFEFCDKINLRVVPIYSHLHQQLKNRGTGTPKHNLGSIFTRYCTAAN